MERSGISMYLMMCTLVDYEGKVLHDQEKLKVRAEALGEAIHRCLRRGDVFTRYSASQYLILLMNLQQEDCEMLYRRISAKLKELISQQAEIRYQVASIAVL